MELKSIAELDKRIKAMVGVVLSKLANPKKDFEIVKHQFVSMLILLFTRGFLSVYKG